MLPVTIEGPIVDWVEQVGCRVLADSVTRLVHHTHP